MIEFSQYKKAADFLRESGFTAPKTGIVLGTGLGNFISEIEIEKEISYDAIPHFPVSTVEFHKGKLIYGKVNGRQVLVMNGRFHYYEGYNMQQVAFPIRVMKLLGIEELLISNAAGAMNLQWKKGELMLVKDHINLLPNNPLVGKNIDEFGPRFPDMSEVYPEDLRSKLKNIADKNKITLREGVYVSVTGPQLESPAEYRFLHKIGADAVGMSTVPEVVVARHAGIPVAAISVLTDECDPDHLQPVNITEIIEVARHAEIKLTKLFKELIAEL